MKINPIKFLLPCAGVLMTLPLYAQSSMEEYFYASGKIKVVAAVAIIVLAGIFVYLFRIDKKLSSLEKHHDKKDKR